MEISVSSLTTQELTVFEEILNKLLEIKSYFELIKYCEENNLSHILKNKNFWDKKISNYEIRESLGSSYLDYLMKTFYIIESRIKQIGNNYTPTLNRKYFEAYGDDRIDLLDKARILRKEINKNFKMEYENIFIRFDAEEYPEEEKYGWDVSDLEELGLNPKPGQFILVQVYDEETSDYHKVSFFYIYQIGNTIECEESKYPYLPEKLFEDISRGRIKDVYKIEVASNKL